MKLNEKKNILRTSAWGQTYVLYIHAVVMVQYVLINWYVYVHIFCIEHKELLANTILVAIKVLNYCGGKKISDELGCMEG
jgi:hypothetical protein